MKELSSNFSFLPGNKRNTGVFASKNSSLPTKKALDENHMINKFFLLAFFLFYLIYYQNTASGM